MRAEDPKATETKSKKSSSARTSVVAIITLVIGLVVGGVATKYLFESSTAVAGMKSSPKAQASASTHETKPTGSAQWNPFQALRDMQLHLDQMFNNMSAQFHKEPKLSVFPDNPGYSLSLNVQDLKDHYEVHAFLPNAKASDIDVSMLNKQTLKVEVDNKSTETSTEKNGKVNVTEWGQYAQTIQLPTPVKAEQMKVEHQGQELLITLPKA